jgi:putative endonuclease
MWHIYILRCSDGTLYTGITTDLIRRVQEHNEGKVGSKYARPRRPVTLMYSETVKNRGIAQEREAQIKKLSRIEKERLIKNV